MNVLANLEATLVFLGTSYVSSVILLHKLIPGLVNHISEELEPNRCNVYGQICKYVLFNTIYVKYITHFNEKSFTKFIKHFFYNINYVKMMKNITHMHTYITCLSNVYY